jgi:hypothetical protein
MIDEIKNLEMMSATLVPLLVMLHRMALAQFAPLEPSQYIALMNVYDGLGTILRGTLTVGLKKKNFAFFSGCTTATICPRFNMSSICEGSLTCTVDDVTALCVATTNSQWFWLTMHFHVRDFRNVGLTGTISTMIAQLTSLRYLCVDGIAFDRATFNPTTTGILRTMNCAATFRRRCGN